MCIECAALCLWLLVRDVSNRKLHNNVESSRNATKYEYLHISMAQIQTFHIFVYNLHFQLSTLGIHISWIIIHLAIFS